ncbi:MAG: selenoneine synthase SenA [Acidobacteriota bacterium]
MADVSPTSLTCRPSGLIDALRDARRRTLALVDDLSDEQLIGPVLDIINPLLWEIGHVGWFQERWALRELLGRRPLHADGDSLYDSSTVPHDRRWHLPLPSRQQTLDYMQDVLDAVCHHLADLPDEPVAPRVRYFHLLALAHEDMHGEAFAYARQTLAYPAPPATGRAGDAPAGDGPAAGSPETEPGEDDIAIAGGAFLLGSSREAPFLFDNEKWAHEVEVAPFSIARTAVTVGQFRAFVDDGGYQRENLWSRPGRRWLATATPRHPLYWRRDRGGWIQRRFDQRRPLVDEEPMMHVNAFEAGAYCRWVNRRLPTEPEWEWCATGAPGPDRAVAPPAHKTTYPWGDEPPASSRAHLDGAGAGPAAVSACPAGDSPAGCRQLIGNVWEWTATPFRPYPGFSPDPYVDYSRPWFDTHTVVRGGSWMTPARLIRSAVRSYYTPDRRDVFTGFRTCAADTTGPGR